MQRLLTTAATLLALTLAPAAHAKKGEVDFSDAKSVLKGADFYGFDADAALSKKTGLPKRVAIGGFQIQYTFQSQEFGYGEHTGVRFAEEDYVAITNALRDELAGFLVERGYEVVPHEEVVASEVYQSLQGKTEAKVKGRKGVYTADGMQRLNYITTKLDASPNMLAGLNKELNTDAVLFVMANFAVCEMGGGKKNRGTKICLGVPISGANKAEAAGSALKETFRNYQALSVDWMMGYRESKGLKGQAVYAPKWVGHLGKSGIGSPLVLMDENVRKQVKKGIFGGKYAADYDAFVDGALSLWDTSLTLGFAPYDADRAKLAKKLQ